MDLKEFVGSITLSQVAWFIGGVLTFLIALSGFLEKVFKASGPVRRLWRFAASPYRLITSMRDTLEQNSIKMDEYSTAINGLKGDVEVIKHEVQTNSGSSLKDAVIKGNREINSKLHFLNQRLDHEENFSTNLRFTITPAGVSKSNHAAKAIFGYPDSEQGASISWQNTIPFPQRKMVLEQWNYAWTHKAVFECEFYVIHADRSRGFHCHVEAIPICDLEGMLLMHSGSIAILEKDIPIAEINRRLKEQIF